MDLNGVNILIPHYLRVMEWVVNEHKSTGVNSNELRKASVSILLSLSCYPLHFGDLQIKGMNVFLLISFISWLLIN